MEPEKLREWVVENQELENQLTKKNTQYIFHLKKMLSEGGMSEEDQVILFHDMLPQMVSEQKKGITARHLFGTASERAVIMLNQPKSSKTSPTMLLWMDNVLLLFGMMTILLSIMLLPSNSKAQPLGITTFILSSLVGGYLFYMMNKYIYGRDPNTQRTRSEWLKSTGLLIGGTLIWAGIFSTSSVLLPKTLNPILPPNMMIGLGILAIVVRYWLRKKYELKASLFRAPE